MGSRLDAPHMVSGSERGEVSLVYNRGTKGNSATFAELGDLPLSIGLEDLCGCTAVVVVSRRAVWFAHFFESISFSPKLNKRGTNAAGKDEWQIFFESALEFAGTGIDSYRGQRYVGLESVSRFFGTDDSPAVFIITPQNEADSPKDMSTNGRNPDPGLTKYRDGRLYEAKVDLLKDTIIQLLQNQNIPVTIFTYQALNQDSQVEDAILSTSGRGKSLFEYDPNYDANLAGRRGLRLIVEGFDYVAMMGLDEVHIERGIIYDDYWYPQEVPALGEDRILSGSSPEDTELLLCGDQYFRKLEYTCFANGTLCPILDGQPTLLCGSQCYLESLYVCYGAKLCPVLDGQATLACGDDCYLPSEYSCVSSQLIQIHTSNNPDQSGILSPTSTTSAADQSESLITSGAPGNPDQSGNVIPTGSPGMQGAEIVFDGTTFTIGSQTSTLTADGQTVTVGPGGLVIGTTTVPVSPSADEPQTITADGVTVTLMPHQSASTSQFTSSTFLPSNTASSSQISITTTTPAPGSTLPSSIPSTTAAPVTTPSSSTTSTVITITASDGSSTAEITFTPTTFTEFTALPGKITLTTSPNGVATTLVVGPGGIAWEPVSTGITDSGFPPVPFPTIPPAPQSTSALPSPTSTTSEIFPSSVFPLPPIVTKVVTSDIPGGSSVITTITGTADSNGVIIPVTTLSTSAAIASAKTVLSDLSSLSDAVVAFSSTTADTSKASAVTTANDKAHSDNNGFGLGLGISSPGLCLIFCGSAQSISFIFDTVRDMVLQIVGGTASAGSITNILADLTSVITTLREDIEEAESNEGSSTGTATRITSTSCSTQIPVTNCEVFCSIGTYSGDVATTSCFSTTCSSLVACDSMPTTSTSFNIPICPATTPASGGLSIYSYPGFTFRGVKITTTESTTAVTSSSETTTAALTTTISTTTETSSTETTTTPLTSTISTTTQTSTSTTETPTPTSDFAENCYSWVNVRPSEPISCAELAADHSITVEQLLAWNPVLETTDVNKCDFAVGWANGRQNFCIGVNDPTSTSSSVPTPTAVTKCDTYDDCPRCQDGYYRCCLAGCSGHLVPESNTCGCVQDGHSVSPVCGCK
ncbi:hypothetical protein N7462_006543 [Penicillium macrosclerotiorum]|uniref:uncharacterized protein n=1 Tax=Penicillium macrosclerotiorum TaxID=303699 RepID=UPI00254821AE|nr:uncharacterized protein N7462_006543 [Penicillium macrosclerotiorum]KAJ5683378.1 hypothetical protein N7462_006543 [Penicillium macrosclerotiorum]